MLALIAAKSDYLVKANTVLKNLSEYEDTFALEAQVISYAKCLLIRDEELEDYSINGIAVEVYRTNEGYQLYFADLVMDITVYEKQIIDCSFSRR